MPTSDRAEQQFDYLTYGMPVVVDGDNPVDASVPALDELISRGRLRPRRPGEALEVLLAGRTGPDRTATSDPRR